MKTLIAASLLLALASPAHASELRNSDQKWVKTVDQYGKLFDECFYRTPDMQEDDKGVPHAPACEAERGLRERLEASGYCVVGKAVVGRPSRGRGHCYEINWPTKPN